MPTSEQRLLIVGFSEYFQIGAMLYHTGQSTEISTKFYDANFAYRGAWLIQRINWRLRGRRPVHLSSFSEGLVELCKMYRPNIMLVTGMLPPDARSLAKIRQMGIVCINYLTDDPWNARLRAEWFMYALPNYDLVFSPRRGNLNDLTSIGCRAVYLPFAYDPTLHFSDSCPPKRAKEFECDVLFYGGADDDRVPYIAGLIDAGHNVHLYGDYWNRYAQTRSAHKGRADIQMLRWAVSGAKVTLCLVRRANRDGHVMRTFEAPAMGACLLAEDTEEHRDILGPEGEAALYFRTIEEMKDKARYLLCNEQIRAQLIQAAHSRIARSENTYASRLAQMLDVTQNRTVV